MIKLTRHKFFIFIAIAQQCSSSFVNHHENKFAIVGGDFASRSQFPHQVSLQAYNSHFCGGAIYNERTIITAAHCCGGHWSPRPEEMSVVAGTILLDDVNGKKRQAMSVMKTIVHENLNGDDDICLVILDNDLQFDEYVKPVRLPTSRPVSGKICSAAGWGQMADFIQHATNDLRYTEFPIIEHSVCAGKYLSELSITINPQKMICAGNDQDVCFGDSGGALLCDGELTGITSFGGKHCADPEIPSVFTQVYHYKDWILQNSYKKQQFN